MNFNIQKVILSLAFFIAFPGPATNAGPPKQIREPAVSGAFYSSSADELRTVVDELLKAATPKDISGRILTLIVPHAGYTYSGQVAAEGFRQLQGKPIDTIVIAGPSHRIAFDGISVYPEGFYKTPLGLVEIDAKLAQEIINMDEMIRFYSPAHAQEHAIEVELPFIQRVLPKAKIVPIVVGSQTSAGVRVLENVFKQILSRERTLLVMSVDLSHFHSYDEAVKLDTAGLKAVEQLDAVEFAKRVNAGETEWDNPAGVMAMLMANKSLGAEVSLLKYANSGDVTGDKSRVVGYSAVMVALPSQEEIKLGDSDRQELLKLARASIEEYLSSGKIPQTKPKNPELLKKRGAFVTLKKSDMLRGCIGYTQPIMPLCKTIARAAVAAATEDTRFEPVSQKELEGITISISVLSLLRRITNIEEIQVGTHGLVIRKSGHSGLLLPQVPTEQGWDKMTFLKHICLKAGLPTNAWENNADLYVFTADVFSE